MESTRYDPTTVHMRNLVTSPQVTVHLEDAAAAVIAEGEATHALVTDAEAHELASASQAKYGYASSARDYVEAGVWRMQPSKVIAWTTLYEDATKFVFAH